MAVNNANVQKIAQTALDNHPTGKVIDRVEQAWREVNTKREAGGSACGDEDLAAADHYLFMRYVSNLIFPASGALRVLTWAYDGLYKGVQDLIKSSGNEIVFRTGKCPATSFSLLVILWGLTGIMDGEADAIVTPSTIKVPSSPNLVLGVII